MADKKQILADYLIELYERDYSRVATACDEHLDCSGKLLGLLRDAVCDAREEAAGDRAWRIKAEEIFRPENSNKTASEVREIIERRLEAEAAERRGFKL